MVAASALPGPSAAQIVFGGNSPVISAEILPGWRTENGTRMAALHLRLAEGWKTYWRVPGDAGIAPRIDWAGSQNVAGVVAHWPRPVVFDQNGFRSIGYVGELVLPLEVTPLQAGRPMALTAQLSIGVCHDTCVPVDMSLSTALRGDGAPDTMIAAALRQGSRTASGNGLSRATCRVEPTERGVELTLRATLPRQGTNEFMVMELPGTDYWISDNRTWREGGELVARARVHPSRRGAPVSIDRSALAFTVLTDDLALAHQGCVGG